MFSVMARRAAKSGLAAGQDELGSGSSREEEQGEAGADSRVARGTTRQTSGPRKSGVAGKGGDAEGGKTQVARDGGRAVAEEEGGEKSVLGRRVRSTECIAALAAWHP